MVYTWTVDRWITDVRRWGSVEGQASFPSSLLVQFQIFHLLPIQLPFSTVDRNKSVVNMPRPSTRQEVLARLRKTIDSGEIIIGAGAGTSTRTSSHPVFYTISKLTPRTGIGLSAKFIEKGGADLLLVYNSGRFRMAGRGSLAGMMPYSDANQVVVDMVLPLGNRHKIKIAS